MEAVQKTLQKAHSILSIARNEIETRLKNPQVQQWEKVNLRAYEDLLPHLSLSKDLFEAKKTYKNHAQELFSRMDKWQNEIGNLETDIQHSQISPDQALGLAKNIEKGAKNLGVDIKRFRALTDSLINADTQIRSLLNLPSMLEFTQDVMSENKRHFNEGYQLYCLLEEEKNDQCQQEKLSDIFTMATAIDQKMQNIDLSSLPKMAADVLAFHITSSRKTIDAIKQFVEKASTSIAHEKNAIDKYKEQFEGLKDASADVIFKTLEPSAIALQKNILKLRAHSGILEKIQLTKVLFNNLNLFYATIQNSFIGALSQSIEDRQSLLNPYSLAHKNATEYFMGLAGMFRSFKLLFKKLTGNSRLNLEALTQTLENSINSCTLYLGGNTNITKMEAYIDSHLNGYSQPFPYDGLFQLMRNTLGDYGSRLEKYLYSFPINHSAVGNDMKGGTTTLGKLFDKMEVRRENLKNIQ